MKSLSKVILLLSVAFLLGFCSDSGDEELDWATAAITLSGFTDNGDGTVTQGSLIWMKCSQGQVWDSAANVCSGTGAGTTYGAYSLAYCEQATLDASGTCSDLTSYEANDGPAYDSCANLTFAGFSDWRLPTRYELDLLAEGFSREFFLYMFPQTPDDKYFWSGSTDESDTSVGYTVSFAKNTFGNVEKGTKTGVKYVRCVR